MVQMRALNASSRVNDQEKNPRNVVDFKNILGEERRLSLAFQMPNPLFPFVFHIMGFLAN